MKTNWPTKKLGEIAQCTDGDWILSKDLKTGKDVRLIQLGDIGDGMFLNKTNKWISKKRSEELNCTILKSGDILLARLGDPLAKACIFNEFNYSCITAVDVTIIRTKSEVETNFLLLYLNSLFFKKQVDELASGATRKRISRKNLESLFISLPPLSEQKRIVKKIEKLFEKVDEATHLRKEAISDSEAILSSALYKIFSNPEGEEKSLGEITKLTRGPFGGSLKKDIFVDNGYKVYEQKNAISNDFTIGKYFITKEKFEDMRRFAVSAGNLIMSCSGTIGKIGIVPKNTREGIINQALLKISPSENVLSIYLKYALESPILQEKIFVNTLGLAIKNVAGVKILKEIKIPLPPISKQRKIVHYLDSLSKRTQELISYQKSQLKDLEELKQSILHKAFQGELI